jgi:hypothetical protein
MQRGAVGRCGPTSRLLANVAQCVPLVALSARYPDDPGTWLSRCSIVYGVTMYGVLEY